MSKVNITKLNTPYVSVDGSYGGNQGWFKETDLKRKKTLEEYGCGLIGASDLISHILGNNSFTREEYHKTILNFEKKYFHILPKLGISGILIAWGLNLYFLLNRKKLREETGAKYRARWFVRPSKMLDRIKEMLDNDLPIIFAIGPGFFRKNKVNLYYKEERDGKVIFKPVTKTKDHYVTITGVEEYPDNDKTMLEISSWGRKYYVNYSEYKNYVKKNDNYYFSNILYIKKISQWDRI